MESLYIYIGVQGKRKNEGNDFVYRNNVFWEITHSVTFTHYNNFWKSSKNVRTTILERISMEEWSISEVDKYLKRGKNIIGGVVWEVTEANKEQSYGTQIGKIKGSMDVTAGTGKR